MNKIESIKSVIIVGAGNVGWHYAHAFYQAGIHIELVISRNIAHAKKLASEVGSGFSTDLNSVSATQSLIILTLSDSVLDEYASLLDERNFSVVHTSGSLPISLLEKSGDQYGVVYPAQSLIKGYVSNFSGIPLCLEASSDAFMQQLVELCTKISDKVVTLTSEQRKNLHLAAILVNNFANFLMTSAADFLGDKDISFDLLHPIITLTAEKVQKGHPKDMQTGPAKRGNKHIIAEHIKMLEGRENLQHLYKEFSRIIQEYYKV